MSSPPSQGKPLQPGAQSEAVAGAAATGRQRRRHLAGTLGHTPINRLVSTALLGIVVGLIPWTAWLWASLPRRYDAHEWNIVWAGFDTFLITSLAYCAWAMWSRRQVMIPTALIAGTLLVCDAWFDVVTALGSKGEVLTVVTACCGELPLAAFFFFTAARVMRRSVAAFHVAMGYPGPPPRLRDAPLVYAAAELSRPQAPGEMTAAVEGAVPEEPGGQVSRADARTTSTATSSRGRPSS